MRTGLLVVLGLVLGLVGSYVVALLWNPSSYESALPLLLAGAIVGLIMGVVVARRTPAPTG